MLTAENKSSIRRDSAVSRPSSLTWTLVLTSVAFFMVNLDALVVVTALPAIHRDLGASLSTLQWTVNVYSLAWAAGIATAAALGDRYGRRKVFAVGLALFATASAASALAPNSEVLIGARAIQGIGSAIIVPLGLTVLTTAFPAERRGAAVGIWSAIAGLAAASGPLIGGALVQALSWHWIFWVNVPIGLVAAALALARLPESFGAPTRLDLPAVALVSGGAIGIVLGMIKAAETGWNSSETIVTLGLGVLALTGFVSWEMRAREPMLPVRLFRSVTFSAANTTGFFMTGSLFAAVFLVAQYFQIALGQSPFDTGLRLLPWTLTPLVVAPLAGVLSDRVGQRPLMVVGMALQGAGLAWFAALAGMGVEYRQLVLPMLTAGVGVSIALPVTATAVLSAVARPEMGKASAVQSTLQRFGIAFGIAVATAVFAASGNLGTPLAFTAGFRPAMEVVAGLSVLGAVSAIAVGKPRAIAINPAAGGNEVRQTAPTPLSR